MEQNVIDAFLNYFRNEPDGICWFETPGDIKMANELVNLGVLVCLGEELGTYSYRMTGLPPRQTPVVVSPPAIVPAEENNTEISTLLFQIKQSNTNTAQLIDKLLEKVNR